MSKSRESLLAGAAAGCFLGVALFTRSQSLAWQMYGGLVLLLSAAVLIATALAQVHAPRRAYAPLRWHHHPGRHSLVLGRVLLPVRRR